MSDLIDRQAAIDAVIEWYGCEPNDIDAFKEIIYNKSSAQPEIIRCGECKHHEGETYCHERDGLWYENDYCRYAERKEQDDG